MLELKNLTVYRGDRFLFDSLNHTIIETSSVHISGCNGVGKSTLLKVIAGLIPPDDGFVLYNNQPVTSNTSYKQKLCYLASPPASCFAFDLDQFLKWRSLLEQSIDSRWYQKAMVLLDLTASLSVPMNQLSSGQLQKVGLLSLWDESREIFLLDEPLTHLDNSSCMKILNQLEVLKRKGATLVIVSHESLPSKLVDTTVTLQ